MRAIGHLFLLWLLAASLMTTSALHAQEFPGSETVDCSGFVHSEGDSDETQGDADRAAPHHHTSCHTSFGPAPHSTDDLLVLRPVRLVNRAFDAPGTALSAVGPDLRPPIA
ncbi:hypothetical protein MTR62_08225 [Novosphingobium sp. 1949]|uniref:Secreted protein n=1 Tax=Novosphingobium organovorum TaxID=2930092 RepID=A0ABT0BC89_9SPHN|nr:hypothetical protein [Novosphingobium organovorum]MCJ2182674.1 hypothetical protein [Novosphingobium organovorum]